MFKVTTTFTNKNPNTIWNKLAEKLGREPTNAEAKAEVLRLLDEAHEERARAAKLPYQRKRGRP